VDEGELLRLEYARATDVERSLTEIRFKLLALVPSLSGAVVALVSAGRTGVELLAIGLLGLAATAGVLVYELRNAQLRRAASGRAKALEARLLPGGALSAAPTSVGGIELTHGLGVALVYGAALGGWCYLVAWGALRALGAGHAQSVGLVVGAVAAVLLAGAVLRLERGGTG
jgi:hypothetical protein